MPRSARRKDHPLSMRLRLDLAADHLRAGRAKISEIATLVGYGSEAAMNRAFKAQYGMTPAAFRRNGGRRGYRRR